MSLQFIINLDEQKNDYEKLVLEFWPDRGTCQARAVSRQGVVQCDRQMPMPVVVAGLREALGIDEARSMDRRIVDLIRKMSNAIPLSYVDCQGNKCREPHCIACQGEDDAKACIDTYARLTEEAEHIIGEMPDTGDP